jgi:hypothetical protein
MLRSRTSRGTLLQFQTERCIGGAALRPNDIEDGGWATVLHSLSGRNHGAKRMPHAIIRGPNGRRHEVNFGNAPVRVNICAGAETAEIFM